MHHLLELQVPSSALGTLLLELLDFFLAGCSGGVIGAIGDGKGGGGRLTFGGAGG